MGFTLATVTIRAERTITPGRAYTARPDSGAPLVWSFRALQPLTPACVETIAPFAPTVGDMIVRIKRLGAAARRHALT